MLRRLALLLALATALPATAGLRADEAAFSARLQAGERPPTARGESEQLRAARGALALVDGDRAEAARLFGSLERLGRDCALRARLTELGEAEPCGWLRPGALEPALLEAPAVFAIVAADEREPGSSFLANVLATALKALAPAGGLRIESSADRFRVTGSSALEGTLYLEDRILLAARPAPGRGDDEAHAALAAFLALRPGAATAEPPQAERPVPAPVVVERERRVHAHGVSVALPSGWSEAAGDDRWSPSAGSAESFPSIAGGLAVFLQPDDASSKRKRNKLARRKPGERGRPASELALPEGARLVDSHALSEPGATTSLEWELARGERRLSFMRSLTVRDAKVLVVAHVGEELPPDEALALLGSARREKR